MKKPSIIFIPTKFNHWEIYYPLIKPLCENNIDVHFVLLNNYLKSCNIPNILKSLNLKSNIVSPSLNIKIELNNRIKLFYAVYSQLLPWWRRYLKKINKGVVVVAQDGAPVQRMLLNSAKILGFKTISIQDGYFVSNPTKYGWKQEGAYKLFLRKIFSITPLHQFITKGFGTSSDYCCLYGSKIKNKLCRAGVLNWNNAMIIGSPRFMTFKEKVAGVIFKKDENNFRVLCLPTTFPAYNNKNHLYNAQDEAILWIINEMKKYNESHSKNVTIDIKLKRGYDNQLNHYFKLFNQLNVKVYAGNASLEEFIARSDLVVTMGSTAALEAAICHKPVVQIMPSYLFKCYSYIDGIPIAKNRDELHNLFYRALSQPEIYCNDYCKAQDELIDINPEWNSIEAATNWLFKIIDNI